MKRYLLLLSTLFCLNNALAQVSVTQCPDLSHTGSHADVAAVFTVMPFYDISGIHTFAYAIVQRPNAYQLGCVYQDDSGDLMIFHQDNYKVCGTFSQWYPCDQTHWHPVRTGYECDSPDPNDCTLPLLHQQPRK